MTITNVSCAFTLMCIEQMKDYCDEKSKQKFVNAFIKLLQKHATK